MLGDIRVCRSRMERPQRLAMNDQRNGDIVGPADAVEMVLDVADARS